MTVTAFDLAFDAPSRTLPALNLVEAYSDGSLEYTTSLVDEEYNITIPLLLVIHKGKLVHEQEVSGQTHARLEPTYVRECSDGSLVYHLTLSHPSQKLYTRVKCIIFKGHIEHMQELTLEDYYAEEAQFTARMMQRELEDYVMFSDPYYLSQFLHWSRLNTEARTCLMQLLEA